MMPRGPLPAAAWAEHRQGGCTDHNRYGDLPQIVLDWLRRPPPAPETAPGALPLRGTPRRLTRRGAPPSFWRPCLRPCGCGSLSTEVPSQELPSVCSGCRIVAGRSRGVHGSVPATLESAHQRRGASACSFSAYQTTSCVCSSDWTAICALHNAASMWMKSPRLALFVQAKS